MSRIKKYISPRSTGGSIFWSLGVHLFVAGSVVGYMNWSPPRAPVDEEYVDLDYQMFDEPPVVTEQVARVKNTPTPTEPVKPDEVPDDSPKELQDETSDVAGTQEAKPTESNIGSNNNGVATATPYYKIKPKYPRAALLEGKEGWVLFEIDITENGEVENIRVMDGEERNLFLSDARRALAKWRYRPFVDKDGKPIRRENYAVRIDFKLEDATDSSSL